MPKIEVSGVEKAIRLVGSQKAVARRMGVSQPSVARWKKTGLVPPTRVLGLEAISGVPRYELNPEVYPPE